MEEQRQGCRWHSMQGRGYGLLPSYHCDVWILWPWWSYKGFWAAIGENKEFSHFLGAMFNVLAWGTGPAFVSAPLPVTQTWASSQLVSRHSVYLQGYLTEVEGVACPLHHDQEISAAISWSTFVSSLSRPPGLMLPYFCFFCRMFCQFPSGYG